MASKRRSCRLGRDSLSKLTDRPAAGAEGGPRKRKADQHDADSSRKSARFVKMELAKPLQGRPTKTGRKALQVDSLVTSSAGVPKADGSNLDNALRHAPVTRGAVGAGNNSGVMKQAGEKKAKRGRGRPRREAVAMALAQTQAEADSKSPGPVAKSSHAAEDLEGPAAVRKRSRGRSRKVDAKAGNATHVEQDVKGKDGKRRVAKEPETLKPRKRGRPAKAAASQAAEQDAKEENGKEQVAKAPDTLKPRKRGRPASVLTSEAAEQVAKEEHGKEPVTEEPENLKSRKRGRPTKVATAQAAQQDVKGKKGKEQVAKESETLKPRKRGRPAKAAAAQAAAPGNANAICKKATPNEPVKPLQQPVPSGKLLSPSPKGRENTAPELPAKESGAFANPRTAQASPKPLSPGRQAQMPLSPARQSQMPLSPARQVQMPSGPVPQGLEQPCAPAQQPRQHPGLITSACKVGCEAEVQMAASKSDQGVTNVEASQQEAEDLQSLGNGQGCPVPIAVQSHLPETETAASASDPNWFDPADPAKVRAVESTIHRSHALSGKLPLGRDAQTSQLSRLLQEHTAHAQGGSIYISGMPGTGKSLSVDEVARQFAQGDAPAGQPVVISVNCMSLPQPRAVYRRILDQLQHSTDLKAGITDPEACPLELLKEAVRAPPAKGDPAKGAPAKGRPTKSKAKAKPRGMVLLVLDEIDQLVTRDQTVLYELFALPQLKGSRLILVGISNSIDLTHRTLPKLQEMGSHPAEIPFPSYSAQQVQTIIQQRLAALPGPAFQPAAVAFCARKVAARSGDMRRALEACSCALQHLVADVGDVTAEQGVDKNAELQPADARIAPSAGSVPRRRLVGVGEMAKAISSLQGGSGEASVAVQAMRALPQQQQLVMCATAKLLGQADNADAAGSPSVSVGPATPASVLKARPRMVPFMSPAAPSPGRGGTPAKGPPGTPSVSRSKLLGANTQACALGALHESYSQLCKQIAIKPLSNSEFAEACSTLEDMGLLGLSKAREPRLRRVTLRAHKDDVALALQDVRLLRNVLSLA